MGRSTNILGVVSIICLMAVQASGLHLHVDETGRNAGLHSAHMHHAHRADHEDRDHIESQSHQGDLHAHPSGDHDHSEESDVSLFEQLNSSPYSDMGAAALIQTPPLPEPLRVQIHFLAPPGAPPYEQSWAHWRPPLRAPPSLA